MKKQEMLNKLTDYFCSKSRETPVIMAKEVLDLIEAEGMLPPSYVKDEGSDGVYRKTKVVEEWEPS